MDENIRTLSTFRMHLIVTCMIVTLSFVAAIALSIFVPLATHLDRDGLTSAASSGIAEHFLYLHAAFWPVALCSLVGCVVSALLLYQKMVGPLVRFVRCFDAVSAGELPGEIRIRKTDYLAGSTAELNRMIRSLREQRERRLAAQRELEIVAEEILADAVDSPRAGELVERIRNLKDLT